MRNIRFQVILLAVVPLLFLLFFLGSVASLQRAARSAAAWSDHSDVVLQASQRLQATLADVQATARGYALTGDAGFFTRSQADSIKVPREIRTLRRLVADNPDQGAQVDRLGSAATHASAAALLIAIFSRDLRSASHGAENATISRPVLSKSDREMRRFHAAIERFDRTEGRLKAERAASLARLWSEMSRLMALGTLLGSILTLALAGYFGLRLARRIGRLAGKAAAFAAGESIGPPIGGSDEIAELDRSFEQMATVVRERANMMARYRLLAEQARDAMIFFRRSDGQILEANRAAEELYGYSGDELLHMSISQIRAPSSRSEIETRSPPTGDFNVLFEGTHLHKNGSEFPVEVASQSAQIADENVVLSIIRDITDRRRAEEEVGAALAQAVEASRLKSEFVATMSHEIRTPMNAVIGMSELLLETPLGAEQREYASVLRDSGHALLEVISDILDFSKIEAGRLDLERVDFELLPLVEGVGTLLVSAAQAKELSLMTFVDPAIPQRLIGDPSRLRQVLVNLVGNAIKFTSNGGVVVTADLQGQAGRTATLRFAVADTGIGIAPEIIPRLFQAFRQADGSTTRKYGGTGLGLAISKRIVELAGGTLGVESVVDIGSTFSFTVDFHRSETQPQPRDSGDELRNLRVLVVHDDTPTGNILGRYPSSWHLRHSICADARSAYLLAREAAEEGEPFDVALVDLRLPDEDGFALASRIRNEERLRSLRLVLITAFDAMAQERRAIAAGFMAYLVKPIRQSQLYRVRRKAPAFRPGI